MHRESWKAWFGYGAISIIIFAVFWFYAILHLLLRIPLAALLGPFVALVVIVGLFAVAAKVSRELLINQDKLAPMVASVCIMFLAFMWCCAFYGSRLGLLSSDDQMFFYIASPLLLLASGIGTRYTFRKSKIGSRLRQKLGMRDVL